MPPISFARPVCVCVALRPRAAGVFGSAVGRRESLGGAGLCRRHKGAQVGPGAAPPKQVPFLSGRRALLPRREQEPLARCGGGARRGPMGPEVGPAFQRLSRDTPSSNLDVRFGGNGVQALLRMSGSKRPGNSGLRAAIRTAARARSGRANDMGGIR
eukprot:gene15780-biopygen3707